MGVLVYGPVNEVFFPYSAGSVSAAIVDTVNGYIAGKSPNPSVQNLYSSYGVRNPNVITGTLDLSPLCMTTNVGSPVLISPRHVLSAAHVSAPTGVRFLKSDGTQVYRAVVSSTTLMQPTSPSDISTDIRISLLESQITDIAPAKVPPSNFYDKLPGGAYYGIHILEADSALNMEYLPLLRIEAHLTGGASVVIQQCQGLREYVVTSGKPVLDSYGPSTDTIKQPQWQEWGELVVGGDSGGVLFWPVNGELCVVGTMYSLYSSTPGEKRSWFFPPAVFSSEISSIMCDQAFAYDADATAYALTHQDWAGFSTG